MSGGFDKIESDFVSFAIEKTMQSLFRSFKITEWSLN